MGLGFTVGVGRCSILPPWGVELAGLGYYLERTWERVRDGLNATALVIGDESGRSVAIVAVDLMYNDKSFTRSIRELIAVQTDIPPASVCINVSHSHNAPTAGLIRGGGERDAEYLGYAARQVATAVIKARRNRQQARLYVGSAELTDMTYNRTRQNGPVDTRVSVLRADSMDGQPLGIVTNFHAHPCAHMTVDLRAISRDVPGEVVDQLEAILPGATALYVQGTCGDVDFRREYQSTGRPFEPARAVTGAALQALAHARPIEAPGVMAVTHAVSLPTRRWPSEEVMREREEGVYRIKTGDTTGWLEGVGRVCSGAPARLPERYDGDLARAVAAVSRFAVEWTGHVLSELNNVPEELETEVQAMRVGDVYFAAHGSELFSTLGLRLRRDWLHDDLFVLGYSNDSIGYMPDSYDLAHRSYAACTSPKATGHFPFTDESGEALIGGLRDALQRTQSVL